MQPNFTFDKRQKGFKQNPPQTKGFGFIEFSAPTDNACTYIQSIMHRLGFKCIAQHKRSEIFLYKQGQIHFLINCETKGNHVSNHAGNFAREHGSCISAIGFWVKNTKEAYHHIVTKGAISYKYQTPYLIPAVVGIGGSLLYCIEGESLDAFFNNEFNYYPNTSVTPNEHGLRTIDHISYNVHYGKIDYWSGFYQKLFNFRQIQCLNTAGQTHISNRALISPCGNICVSINQSNDQKSQIAEYLNAHKGEGVQHVALSTADIMQSTESLAKASIPFVDIPSSYYQTIADELPESGYNLFNLSKYKILIDGETKNNEQKILLQTVTKNLIGHTCFEIIERQGSNGFGTKNFMTLLNTGKVTFSNTETSPLNG